MNNESPAALLPDLASINAQRIEAECFNWLCAHPNWRFIEQLCLRVTAEDTTGFKAQLIAEITKRWGMNEFHRVCDETIASTAPAASESRGSVPEGFVLVPREATDEMLEAAYAQEWEPYEANTNKQAAIQDMRRDYRALIAAAPTPPAVASGEPTAEQWFKAIAEVHGRTNLVLCPADGVAHVIEQRARELARSAAAKGEGQEKPR